MIRAASRPPLHDSARPRRCPASSSRDLGVDRLPVLAEELGAVALGEPAADRLGGRRRLVAVADVDLDLAAPQAGGDLDLRQGDPVLLHLAQALGDFGLGDAEHAQRVAVQRRRPPQQLAQRRRSRAPPATSAAARAAGPGRTTIDALAGGDDEARARSRPGRAASRPRAPSPACGWPPCTASSSNSKRLAKLAQDLGDLRLDLLVEDQLAAGEAADDLGGQVVGGRSEAAGGDDQVHPLLGEEAQRRLEVVGTVGDDQDVGDLDAELGQPFGDPGPVASAIRPVRTSVPVTTIPARTGAALMCRSAFRHSESGESSPPAPDLVAERARRFPECRCPCRRSASRPPRCRRRP